MANIYDIAAKAGVSTATVSRVLAGGKGVSDRLTQRVMEIIELEHYTPNPFARGLGCGSMSMVGVLCTDVSDIQYARAVSEVERMLREHNMDSLLCCTGSTLEGKKRGISLLLSKYVDGIILIGSVFSEADDNSHIQDAAKRVPVASINGFVDIPNVYCALCDERGAICRAVRHFASEGRRNLLYIYDAVTYSGRQKLDGITQTALETGCTLQTVFVERSLEASKEAVERLLAEGSEFDAIVTSDDLMSVGAQHALAGRAIPIIGFDASILAKCATPPLPSIDNRLSELCSVAVSSLTEALSGGSPERKQVIPASFENTDIA